MFGREREPITHLACRTSSISSTCGSPASGSRTRPHAFVHGTSCPSRLQTYEPEASAPSTHPRPTSSEVLANPDLTVAERRAILASWASDARAVEDAPQLRQLENGARMLVGERALDDERPPRAPRMPSPGGQPPASSTVRPDGPDFARRGAGRRCFRDGRRATGLIQTIIIAVAACECLRCVNATRAPRRIFQSSKAARQPRMEDSMAKAETRVPVTTENKAEAPPTAMQMQMWRPFENLRREVDRLFEDFTLSPFRLPFRRPAFDIEPFWSPESWVAVPAVDFVEMKSTPTCRGWTRRTSRSRSPTA